MEGFDLASYVVPASGSSPDTRPPEAAPPRRGGADFRERRPPPRPPQRPALAQGVLRRNDTSFPVKATAKLRELHGQYLAALADPADPEHRWAGILKYYQYLARAVMSSPEFGIGADGNARGLLLYLTMGLGKTREAVAVMMALWDARPPVLLCARGLQENFLDTVREVVGYLHPGAAPEDLAARQDEAVRRIHRVSMDAYNAADQMARAGTGAKTVKRGDVAGATGGLDGKLLIVDEAHNFFRAIINSSAENANARRLYDMVMSARNLRLIFLTGTPASKDPFELVPCFNMLAGRDLLPTQYEIFYKLYVDRERRQVRNRERLANRLVGLVSHVSTARPTEPAEPAGEEGPRARAPGRASRQPRDDGWFPEEFPTILERVPMGADQYRQYLLAREKEEAEGKGGEGAGGRGAGALTTPPLALPGSEKKAMRSYYVKSRSLGIFSPPREWAGRSVDAMPDEAFTEAASPKGSLIARRADAAPGPVLIYSQFVEYGLKPIARYLQLLGYAPYVPTAAEIAAVQERRKTAPGPAGRLKRGGAGAGAGSGANAPRTVAVAGHIDVSHWEALLAGLGPGWELVPMGALPRVDLAYAYPTVLRYPHPDIAGKLKLDARFDPRFTRQAAGLKSVLNERKEPLLTRWDFYERTLAAHPEAAAVLPRTRRLRDVERVAPGEVLIIKREGSWAQEGIAIVSTDAELAAARARGLEAVASDYVRDPLLTPDGKVFVLRAYYLVVATPRAAGDGGEPRGGGGELSGDGRARAYTRALGGLSTAKLPYTDGDWANLESHITGAVWTQKRYAWPDEYGLAPELLARCEESLARVHRVAGAALVTAAQPYAEARAAFEWFAGDIVVGRDGRAWLLELNSKPSLAARVFSEGEPEYTEAAAAANARTAETQRSFAEWVLDCAIRPAFGLAPWPPPIAEGPALPRLSPKAPPARARASGPPAPTVAFSGKGGLDHSWARERLGWRGFAEHPRLGEGFAAFAWGELSHSERGGRYDERFGAQRAELKSVLGDGKKAVVDKTRLPATLGPDCPFLPRTRPLAAVDRLAPGEVLILKRAGGWHRRGVEVVDSDAALAAYKEREGSDGVACDYVRDPLLCRGRKFHLRVYLLAYAGAGLARAHVNPEVQVLTAAEPYRQGDWGDARVHLSGSEGTDRFYAWPGDIDAPPEVIARAEAGLFEAMRAVAAALGREAAPYPESGAAFEPIGSDVMFGADGRAWLLEANDKIGHQWDPSVGRPQEAYSADFFRWVFAAAVLPHFGLGGLPPPGYVGPAATGPPPSDPFFPLPPLWAGPAGAAPGPLSAHAAVIAGGEGAPPPFEHFTSGGLWPRPVFAPPRDIAAHPELTATPLGLPVAAAAGPLALVPFEYAPELTLSELAVIGADPAVYRALGEGRPWDGARVAALWAQAAEDAAALRRRYYHWAIVEGRAAVGYVGLRPRQGPKAETHGKRGGRLWAEPRDGAPGEASNSGDDLQLRYFVAPARRGRGIAPAGVALALDAYAALSAPSNPRVWANVAPDNSASERVLTKLGFAAAGETRVGGLTLRALSRRARPEHRGPPHGGREAETLGAGKARAPRAPGGPPRDRARRPRPPSEAQDILAAVVSRRDPALEADTFPYRRLYLPPFARMLDGLNAVAQRPPRGWALRQEGRLALVERGFPGDYDAVDGLSDWEAEPARVRCREKRDPSPADAWERLRGGALPDDPRARRELVYAAARGCNLFNPAFGAYLLRGPTGANPAEMDGDWGPAGAGPGDVADSSAGWGDRLGAAFVAGARSYRGWDTNPALQPVYAALAARYQLGGLAMTWGVECAPFEAAVLPEASVDTFITSPPFHDQELYEGDGTSTTAHPSAEEWYAGFYRPLWAKAARSLRPGGRVIAYIPPGRMFEEADAVLRDADLTYLGAVGFRQRLDWDGAGDPPRPGKIRDAYIWRRAAGARPARGGVAEARVPEPGEKGHYAIISGEVPTEVREAIKAACTDPANVRGATIKAILVSKTGAEGLDLKYLRETHQVEAYWDEARDDQVKARAVRIGAHDLLPREERSVQPYLYVATANAQIWGDMLPRDREAKTIDEVFYDRSRTKAETNKAFRELCAEVSLECELFNYGNCRVCVPTDAPLFHDDPALDVRLPDPCEVRCESEVQALPITLEGVTYYYAPDPASPLGYAFYAYREDLGGYAPLDTADPVAGELLRLLTAE